MLTIKEKEILEVIIKVTMSIETIYFKLADLEINKRSKDLGKDELLEIDKDIKKQIDYLNIAIEHERELYKKLKLTPERSVEIYNLLKQKDTDAFLLVDEEAIVQKEYQDFSYRRISNKLSIEVVDQILEKDFIIYEDFKDKSSKISTNEDLENLVKYFKEQGHTIFVGGNNEKTTLKLQLELNPILERYLIDTDVLHSHISLDLIKDCRLKKLIEKDFYFTYISLLEEEIKQNSELMEELVKSKYKTIFINESLEDYLLLNNFNVFKKAILSSESTSTQIYEIDREHYSLYKEGLLNLMSNRHLFAMYNSKEDNFEQTIRNTMFKSIVIMSDEKEEFIDKIYSFYDNQPKYSNREKIFGILSNGYEQITNGESKAIKVKIKV